jgi:hypothetical protein
MASLGRGLWLHRVKVVTCLTITNAYNKAKTVSSFEGSVRSTRSEGTQGFLPEVS